MVPALIDVFASAFHKVNISINNYLGFNTSILLGVPIGQHVYGHELWESVRAGSK